MTRRVLKYRLAADTSVSDEPGVLDLPRETVPVHFAFQDRQPTLWCDAREGEQTVPWRYRVMPTGEPVPEDGLCYVGTAMIEWQVWHLFMQRMPTT